MSCSCLYFPAHLANPSVSLQSSHPLLLAHEAYSMGHLEVLALGGEDGLELAEGLVPGLGEEEEGGPRTHQGRQGLGPGLIAVNK